MTNLKKYHFLNPISGFRVIALIGLAFFVVNSCDLFGQDEPKSKVTQFSFKFDPLKGITGSFEDLHIFDDTSFVIVGRFYDNRTSPITSFNQIWWGKKRGIYYKNVFVKDLNDLSPFAHLFGFSGTNNNYVYVGTSTYTQYYLGNYNYFEASSDINNPLRFTSSTFINENDFYLYGKKGVLGLHKNGVFHRIETNTDLDFTHAVWHGDSLLVYGIQFYDTFKSEQAGILVVKDTIATAIDRWGYEQENKKPFYSNSILWEDGAYYFFGQEGIYRYQNQQYVMEEFLPMGNGNYVSRDEGVFHFYDHIYYYYKGNIYDQNYGMNTDSNLIFINHVSIKNNLIVAINLNKHIIIGTR